MSFEENQNILSDQQFDLLLSHALLAHEQFFSANEKTMETMAQEIINTPAIPAHENLSVIERLVADFNRGTKFWLNAFLLLFLLGGTLAAILSYNSPKGNNNPVKSGFITGKDEEKNNPEPLQSINAQELASNPLPVINPAILALTDTNEEIPTLSEAVKKQTAKDKMKMIKDMANPKKKVYGYIPMGTTKIDGAAVSIMAFYIKNSEVTNFEYRTFLNDLLMQGKYDDYLLAKPVSGGWKAAGIPMFEDKYFENEKYNDFPAVNMTRKGAELYCN